MKQQASSKIMRTLLATAIGVMLPAGAAHALDILDNTVWTSKAGAEGPVREETMDATEKHDRIDILDNVIWVPKAGAEGPMREETPDATGDPEQQPMGVEGPMRQETPDEYDSYEEQSESD